MKILGLIPARAGSKGVPGKNIKLLGVKPLIAYSIEAAMAATNITDVVVSTDGDAIADVARKYGVEVPFLRPASLASDTASSIEVVLHALTELERLNREYDAVCLLQPTYPFRRAADIDKAIIRFLESDADSLISVLPVPHEHNPHWVFEPDAENHLRIATGETEIIKRRQDLPKAYFRDGSIYLTKTSVLRELKSFFGKHMSYMENNPEWYVNIDTPEDWVLAEEKVKRWNNN